MPRPRLTTHTRTANTRHIQAVGLGVYNYGNSNVILVVRGQNVVSVSEGDQPTLRVGVDGQEQSQAMSVR